MPEAPEVDTDRLQEIVSEETREERRSIQWVAMTTAVLAAVAAVTSLFAGSTVNEALVLKNESTKLQAEASDQWAYYQAKGIEAAIQDSIAAAWTAAGRTAPPDAMRKKAKEQGEQHTIEAKARSLERERDARSSEGDRLLERHHALAAAVALSQVAIALGAVAALARSRAVWLGSLALGVLAVGLAASALLR